MAINTTDVKTATKTAKAPTKGSKSSPLVAAGKEAYQGLSVVQQNELGKGAADVAFVALIGNPYNLVPRGKDKGPESIGLILKNVSDHEIEVMQIEQQTAKVMDADYAHAKPEMIPAGEEFKVTWAEAGALVTRPEFNGYFAGDAKKTIRYSPSAPKNSTVPTTKFILKKKVKGEKSSIADFVRDIATPEEMENHEVSPEFSPKFSAFAIKQRANKVSAKRSGGRNVNFTALAMQNAFGQLINSGDDEATPAEPATDGVDAPTL